MPDGMKKDAPISRAAEKAGPLSVVRSWADCTINMAEFDLRQAQELWNDATEAECGLMVSKRTSSCAGRPTKA
jgi:hypothetical protein